MPHHLANQNCPKNISINYECTCKETITKPRIPDFLDSLDRMRELHIKKNEDYAIEENPFANFDFTEIVLGMFKNERDKTFVWPIACKLARLANLLSNDKPPNNESIEDTFIDIPIYTLLWKADVKRRQSK